MKKGALPTGNKGYTLFEVLFAVAIFALGSAVVFPVFLKSTDLLISINRRFDAVLLADNWLAKTQAELQSSGKLKEGGQRGRWQTSGQNYDYSIEIKSLNRLDSLYKIDLNMEWHDFRKNKLERSFYALS